MNSKNRNIKFLIIFFCILSILPTMFADGSIHIYDNSIWGLANESSQFCAINYKEGIQNMILSVDTNEELIGQRAVWIFPVPAKPENVSIGIIKGFPDFYYGKNVEENAKDQIKLAFTIARSTQIYLFPELYIYSLRSMTTGNSIGESINIYSSVQRMGVTTELISAKDEKAFEEYLILKELKLPEKSRAVINEYINKEYSFVISWVSDIKQFKQEQLYYGKNVKKSLGIYIKFPSEKIYFPLIPTSVYGDRKVPAEIYILDWVIPEKYPSIEKDTKLDYLYINNIPAPGELEDFFTGYNQTSFSRNETVGIDENKKSIIEEQKILNIKNVKYTRITINTQSNNLNQDLFLKISTPLRVKVSSFISNNNLWLLGIVLFLIISCLSSLISARIIFRKEAISNLKFTLFGFFNSLTLVGFSLASIIMKIDKRFIRSNEETSIEISWRKIILESLIISLTIFIIIYIGLGIYFAGYNSFFNSFRNMHFQDYILITEFYGILLLILFPFIATWNNKNKYLFKFNLLFTTIFVIITIIFQILFNFFL